MAEVTRPRGDPRFPIGTRFGAYEVIGDSLGHGGFSIAVLPAQRVGGGGAGFVIKVLPPDARDRRLRQAAEAETRAAARGKDAAVRHVPALADDGNGLDHDPPYLVFTRYPLSLHKLLTMVPNGHLTTSAGRKLVAHVATGLLQVRMSQRVHAHRDLAPLNILVHLPTDGLADPYEPSVSDVSRLLDHLELAQDAEGRFLVTDFGLSTRGHTPFMGTHVGVGGRDYYRPPDAGLTASYDAYSLGVVLLEAVERTAAPDTGIRQIPPSVSDLRAYDLAIRPVLAGSLIGLIDRNSLEPRPSRSKLENPLRAPLWALRVMALAGADLHKAYDQASRTATHPHAEQRYLPWDSARAFGQQADGGRTLPRDVRRRLRAALLAEPDAGELTAVLTEVWSRARPSDADHLWAVVFGALRRTSPEASDGSASKRARPVVGRTTWQRAAAMATGGLLTAAALMGVPGFASSVEAFPGWFLSASDESDFQLAELTGPIETVVARAGSRLPQQEVPWVTVGEFVSFELWFPEPLTSESELDLEFDDEVLDIRTAVALAAEASTSLDDVALADDRTTDRVTVPIGTDRLRLRVMATERTGSSPSSLVLRLTHPERGELDREAVLRIGVTSPSEAQLTLGERLGYLRGVSGLALGYSQDDQRVEVASDEPGEAVRFHNAVQDASPWGSHLWPIRIFADDGEDWYSKRHAFLAEDEVATVAFLLANDGSVATSDAAHIQINRLASENPGHLDRLRFVLRDPAADPYRTRTRVNFVSDGHLRLDPTDVAIQLMSLADFLADPRRTDRPFAGPLSPDADESLLLFEPVPVLEPGPEHAMVLTIQIQASHVEPDDAPAFDPAGDDELAIADLETGACLWWHGVPLELRSSELVPCEQPHHGQVVGRVLLMDYGTYPRDFRTDARPQCISRFEAFTGEAYVSARDYVVGLPPDRASWARGERTLLCVRFGPLLEARTDSLPTRALGGS